MRAGGAALRYGDGALELRLRQDDGAERSADPRIAEPATPLLASALPAGAMRAAVRDDRRARLTALARVRLRDADHAACSTRCRRRSCGRDRARPRCSRSAAARCRSRARVRLLGVRGYEAERERVRELLRVRLGLAASQETITDEAVRVLGGAPAGISSKVDVPLARQERADRAAVKVLARLLEVMDANLPGTIADVDSEFLHDYRVAVRRSRSVQRELAGVFEPAPLARMRAEFRWLQQSPASPATSTCTCSISRRCEPCSRPSCAPISSRCSG